MKTISRFLLLMVIVSIGLGCTPTPSAGPGIETMSGWVRNENGELLAGIRVEAFYDEGLTKHYPASVWDSWFLAVENLGKELAGEEPVVYTDEEGFYYITADTPPSLKEGTLDLYVVATDTAGIYETQIQKGQIEFYSVKWEDGSTDSSGQGTVNFVLKKKQ